MLRDGNAENEMAARQAGAAPDNGRAGGDAARTPGALGLGRPMRRARQELSEAEALGELGRGEYGTLAVIGEAGYPYAVPINYVVLDGRIYLHCAKAGHKLDAIRADDRVCLTVVTYARTVPSEYTEYYRSVVAFGRAHVVEDERERLASLRALGDRFWPGHDRELDEEVARSGGRCLMVRVDVERLTGKVSKELVGIAAGERP